jgi:hypothetical protein
VRRNFLASISKILTPILKQALAMTVPAKKEEVVWILNHTRLKVDGDLPTSEMDRDDLCGWDDR